jgi:hypothetical protein
VTDEIWRQAAEHYDDKALAALLLAIGDINVWNRLNVAVRQSVGEWKGRNCFGGKSARVQGCSRCQAKGKGSWSKR